MKKRHYIPGIFLILAIILSVYYVFFRDNEIETRLDRSRYILNQRIRNIELERFPLILQIEFDRLLRDFKNIQLHKEWSAELDFDLTHPPFFDLRNIYLVSFDKIAVYNKNNMTSVWIEQFDYYIESFSLVDGNNLLVIDSNGNVYALNRNTGDLNWGYDLNETYFSNNPFSAKPLQITNNEDKRLLTSITLLPVSREILILDDMTGELLFALDFEETIYFLSDYDQLENAIYVAYGNKISKVLLEKR